jgi:putative salt-induced outer membrane protein
VSIAHKDDAWENSGTLAGQYVRTDGDTTARRWEVGAQTRYTFDGGTFWFGGLRYEEDRFSGFDHQGVVNTGVGRRFIDNDTTKLLAQVGAGYKFFETLGSLTEPRDKDSALAGVASVDFQHKLTATTTVFDRFGSEFTSDNNFLQNEIGVQVKMTDRLALALAYAVRHNTDPPAGFKKTDTLTTVNLVYEVK